MVKRYSKFIRIHSNSPTSNNWLGDKREKKQIRRLRKLRYLERKENIKPIDDYYHSEPLDLLNEISQARFPKGKKINASIKMPRVFSIIDSPVDSLKAIYRIANAGRCKRLYSVKFDHSEMEDVDLAAECILDYLAIEILKENKRKQKRVSFSGIYPKDDHLVRYIKAIGLIKNLKIKHEQLSESEESDLRLFRMRSKLHQVTEEHGLGFKEKAVNDFVKHIDSCLYDHGRQLTKASKQLLSEYTGEILDNSEEHSGTEHWSIAGYLDNIEKTHMCEIAIFNFGSTFADTFMELDEDSYAWQEIYPFVDKHSSRGFFGEKWKVEDLYTLIALQGHVSSKNLTMHDDRGQGTVDLIDFFQKVHAECTNNTECINKKNVKMAILSGSTHILFDGTYVMKPSQNGRMVIAFNESNDLKKRPDKRYVKNLGKLSFPGTIISIRFQMNVSDTELVK